jgi:hypothetical protein
MHSDVIAQPIRRLIRRHGNRSECGEEWLETFVFTFTTAPTFAAHKAITVKRRSLGEEVG